MIKRNSNQAMQYIERLETAQLVGSKGIHVKKPCTSADTFTDITNLDIDVDGGLTLRKPLIAEDEFESNQFVRHLFNKDVKIKIIPVWYVDDVVGVILNLIDAGKNLDYIFRYTKYTGEIVNTSMPADGDRPLIKGLFSECKLTNTGTTSILSNLQFHTGTYSLIDPALDPNKQLKFVPRYVRIFIENGNWIVEILNPEPNKFNSAEAAVFNPNLTLDYTYAAQDNYNAVSVGVSNILAYTFVDSLSRPITTKTFENVTIKELTEQITGIAPRILNTVSTENTSPICLKAFVDIKKHNLVSCVCLWEKTFDGVKWEEVPEFLDGSEFEFAVPDNTNSNETLTQSGTYTTLKKVKLFNPKNSNELIIDRPDCLILNTLDTATYRFSIYNLNKKIASFYSDDVDFKQTLSTKVSLSLLDYDLITAADPYNKQDFYKNLTLSEPYLDSDYHRFDVGMGYDRARKAYTFYFKVDIELPYVNVNYEDSKFKVRIVDKDKKQLHVLDTLNVQEASSIFNDETLSYGLRISKLQNIVNNTPVTVISIVGACTLKEMYSFYEMLPTLLKVYYDGELFTTFKILINRYLKYWASGVGTADVPINYSPDIKKDTSKRMYIQSTPYPIQLTDLQQGYSSTNKLYILRASASWSFVLQGVAENMLGPIYKDSEKYPDVSSDYLWFKYKCALGNIEVQEEDIQIPLEENDSRYSKTSKTYKLPYSATMSNGFWYIKNPQTKLTEIIVDNDLLYDSENHQEFTMDILKTFKLSGKTENLPEIYDVVDVSDPEPYTEEFLKIQMTLGFQMYTFTFGKSEILTNDIPNTVFGNKLYYKQAIYTYGKNFKTNIYPTYTGSIITPMFNVIDLNTTNTSHVSSVTPWRDYLIAATENTVHLISFSESGTYTKVINSYIGIPENDGNTCKSILNGIVFKSGFKIYSLTPNLQSSKDDILNISDLSIPIEGLLSNKNVKNFAFTTETAYFLFLPSGTFTTCFKYSYTGKTWTKFVYPVEILDYQILNVEDIRLYSATREYYFDKRLNDIYPNAHENVRYGDFLDIFNEVDVIEYNTQNSVTNKDLVTPIEYSFCTGQKTEQMSITKQFKESKIVLSVQHPKFTFPFTVDVNVDGDSHIIHKDLNTDDSLLKTSVEDIGAAGMTLTTSSNNLFNNICQMFLRYSGRGKTIQHTISGISYFNFKFYMINYKYRILNVKQ